MVFSALNRLFELYRVKEYFYSCT